VALLYSDVGGVAVVAECVWRCFIEMCVALL
jgi:hypothetical protein